ncbi:MAG: flavodoxin family protein [Promethearchaeota archaeon]
MKKTLILYDSVYGNTKKVAMSLSRGLEAGGFHVDTFMINDFDGLELQDYDVIGIGGPTHFHNASKKMKVFLKRIKNLKLDGKYGFAFETKADFRLAGSAAKRIVRYLKKMNMKIIHPPITGLIIDKEGPLQQNTLDIMEQIGINISEKLNNRNKQKDLIQVNNQSDKTRVKAYLNQLKWILLSGGPIFFFVRALYLAVTGGDTFGRINPIFSWFLLLLEIGLSGTIGSSGLYGLIQWQRGKYQKDIIKIKQIQKIILVGGLSTYIIHFVRVAIWITISLI